ncbi:unnamed protein product [Gemmata massiliana]|uniref:Carboxypeptidase regulatory-like domain-containing protein n=1 Tax=Gemmata massiliana TaxID=1210884 RepID=A0A6P2D745_9BACT|nr:hypothetical protein [Gemmata massiliana]VTR95964.1 unnamed protein product [Gemmata massiliana]
MTRLFFLPFVACLLAAGCAADAPPTLYPLTGVLTHGKKPVAGGGLIFMPESDNWGGMVVNASVKADGTFTAETSRTTSTATTVTPGIPAGRYKVAYHPPSDGQVVGGEYHFPDAVTVEARDNTLVLNLPDEFPSPGAKKPNEKGKPPAPGGDDDD